MPPDEIQTPSMDEDPVAPGLNAQLTAAHGSATSPAAQRSKLDGVPPMAAGVVGRARARLVRWLASMCLRWLPASAKVRILVRSGVMDPQWYEGATGRKAVDAQAAASQFFAHDDDPENAANPLFSADWYRANYGVTGTPAELLLHYVLLGERAGLNPTLWFDPAYFRRFQRVGAAKGCALGDYCRTWKNNPSAHPYFDGAWYVWQYPDVLHSWLNPLAHFVAHGLSEGREPNAYFSSRWYVNSFDDVRKSGQNAAVHFCMHGGPEWRSPGPNFDMSSYAEQYPEFAATGLDPFGHFLAFGQGPNAATRYLNLWDLVENRQSAPPAPLPRGQVVDIIIPVYRGLAETRTCIESVLASRNQCQTRIRVYNDASPEPALAAYLREVAGRGEIVLVENARNLGFVGTVNAGMRAAMAQPGTFAVILLNSDTEVAPGWVDRLVAHAGKTGTGTVTATSNNATICSFPSIGSHPWPEGASVRELDRLASEANPGMSIEIPTAVGFCMLITRTCLEEVGRFDEEAFGRGYGEENDFCMRASARGYKHLQALDVFVAHVGEVSFADEGTTGKANAARIIRERYPDYDARVAKHCATDPAKVARLRLIGAIWRAGARPVTAIVTHNLGGGTERHVEAVIEELHAQGRVVVLRPGLGHQSLLKVEN
ncbi:MAG: glycosyltransferase family 2 protein, partial [Pseudomonadota bacterium]|nr:glycosyltransferase family 2 protein [Pseudomonadota bacterium]